MDSPESPPQSPGIRFRSQLVAAKKTAQERQHRVAETRQRFAVELETRAEDAERALGECRAELAAAHSRIRELEAAVRAQGSGTPDSQVLDRSQSLEQDLRTSVSPQRSDQGMRVVMWWG